MAEKTEASGHWLERYANNYHPWQLAKEQGQQEIFRRRIGLVETSFDVDGSHYEGRADLSALLTLEVRTPLQHAELKSRLLLVWHALRLQHPVLLAVTRPDPASEEKYFEIRVPRSREEAVEDAQKTLFFVDEDGCITTGWDDLDLFRHCLNTARIVQPSSFLSKLIVLPISPLPNGNFTLRVLTVSAHMITDGLATYNQMSHFIHLFNSPPSTLLPCYTSASLTSLLPSAQEDLYPPIPGSLPRRRLFWAIARILRHIRKPLPAGFSNPLRRPVPLTTSTPMPASYPALLDYTAKPPLNTYQCSFTLSLPATSRLIALSRAAGTSIGSGVFALVGLAMMELEESLRPDIPLAERRPFIASFPLNPRPFFGHTAPADSCMLGFSDGIVFPFLPSHLPVAGRFKLLARAAHRQLRAYQKRLREPLAGVDPHSPLRLLANNYLIILERVESKLPAHLKRGINPQGGYPANWDLGSATCGVSSVGNVEAWVRRGMFDLDVVDTNRGDVVADFRSLRTAVRARDNEFLVGVNSYGSGMNFGVSFDGNAICEEKVEVWKDRMLNLLEE